MDPDITDRTYVFNLNNPNADILHYYLFDNNPLYESFVEHVQNQFSITFKRPLTSEELTEFTDWILNWQQPSIYLVFDHAETFTLTTDTVNSSDLHIVNTFIMQKYTLTNLSVVLSSLKTLLHLSEEDITSFSSMDDNGTYTIRVQLFCRTTNSIIHDEVVDITSTILGWKQEALNGRTGSVETWIPLQIYGLDNVLPNYDCIWQWKLATSHANIHVALNAMQKIYYNRILNNNV
jgi:hypothetical protein